MTKQAPYALTNMRRGGFRAECHAEDCDWWSDHDDEDAAFHLLRQHMKVHRVRPTMRGAKSTSV